MLKKFLITAAAGAATVYVAGMANEYLNKPDSTGKKPAGDTVAKYAPYIGGGVALAAIAHFINVD